MVNTYTLVNAVLLSLTDKAWKITDFGLTSEGTSRRAGTTVLARGTSGYRAPELVRDQYVSYESDIWSLGCIFYELASAKQLFSKDIDVLDHYYYSKGKLDIPLLPVDERLNSSLTQLIGAMLQIDWWRRPSARSVLIALESFCQDPTEVYIINEQGVGIGVHDSTKRQKPMAGTCKPLDLHASHGTRARIGLLLGRDRKEWENVTWKSYWYVSTCHAC
jgi:serine/threonine protein kinase